MLRSFVADDVYRVMLGARQLDTLNDALQAHALPAEGSLRHLRRDDGSGLWVVVVLTDGDVLERLSLSQALCLMQIDNVSARLRAVPTLPGSTRRCGGADEPVAATPFR